MVEILKASASSDLFNPELLKNRKGQDLVTKDLLGALLAVSLFVYIYILMIVIKNLLGAQLAVSLFVYIYILMIVIKDLLGALLSVSLFCTLQQILPPKIY